MVLLFFHIFSFVDVLVLAESLPIYERNRKFVIVAAADSSESGIELESDDKDDAADWVRAIREHIQFCAHKSSRNLSGDSTGIIGGIVKNRY